MAYCVSFRGAISNCDSLLNTIMPSDARWTLSQVSYMNFSQKANGLVVCLAYYARGLEKLSQVLNTKYYFLAYLIML